MECLGHKGNSRNVVPFLFIVHFIVHFEEVLELLKTFIALSSVDIILFSVLLPEDPLANIT